MDCLCTSSRGNIKLEMKRIEIWMERRYILFKVVVYGSNMANKIEVQSINDNQTTTTTTESWDY